ncbi:MAG: zinc-binding dehydrogenase [Rhodobacterales bacterium]|nr:zinc-binding dehydrogenase [Rhodobacterales bacterium]
MKAAVCRAFGQPLTVEDLDLAAPGPGEVRVDLAACAICHSDILAADGAWGGALPVVYGHEAAGHVRDVGPGVSGLAPGDPVAVTLVRSCGACPCCAKGFHGSCESDFPLNHRSPLTGPGGEVITHGLGTAGFAEAVTVHASQVVPMPAGFPLDRAALLSCGVITGFGAVTNAADIEPGCDVVVVGAGGVGLNSVQAAALRGAHRIIAVDLADDRLDGAALFGATAGVNARAEDAVAAVKRLTGGRGADYVFVTVGAKPAFDQAPLMLAPGGAVVLVGMAETGVTSTYDPTSLAHYSQRIIGSKMGAANMAVDLPRLAALYQDGRLLLDELITGRYPLDDINAAMASAKRGEARRNVVVFP